MAESVADVAGWGRIFDLLDHHRVEYVVIGAAAMSCRGAPRPTRDLDVFAAGHAENHRRLARVLNEIDSAWRTGKGERIEQPGGFDERICAENMTLTLTTEYGDFDVLSSPSGIEDYDAIRDNATIKLVPGAERYEAVITSEDLIRNKRAAGRKKDLEDAARLAEVRDELESPSADRRDPGRRDPCRELGGEPND